MFRLGFKGCLMVAGMTALGAFGGCITGIGQSTAYAPGEVRPYLWMLSGAIIGGVVGVYLTRRNRAP